MNNANIISSITGPKLCFKGLLHCFLTCTEITGTDIDSTERMSKTERKDLKGL